MFIPDARTDGALKAQLSILGIDTSKLVISENLFHCNLGKMVQNSVQLNYSC